MATREMLTQDDVLESHGLRDKLLKIYPDREGATTVQLVRLLIVDRTKQEELISAQEERIHVAEKAVEEYRELANKFRQQTVRVTRVGQPDHKTAKRISRVFDK